MSLYGIGRWATPQVRKDLNAAAQGAQETLLNFFKNGLENIAPGEERALADTIMTEWGKNNLTPPTLTWQANNTWDIYHPNVHGQELQLNGVERLRPVMDALKEVIKAPTSYIDNRFIRDAASLEQYVDYKRIIEATIKKQGNTLKTAEVSLLLDRNSFFHSQLKGHPPFNPVSIKDKSSLQDVLARLVDAADAKVTAKKHPVTLKPVDGTVAAEPVQAAMHPLHPDQPYLKASAYPYAGGYATPTRPTHLQTVGGETPHAVGGGQGQPSHGGYHPTYQGGYVQPHMPPAQPPVSPQLPLSPVVGRKPAPYVPTTPVQATYKPPTGPTRPTDHIKAPEPMEPEVTSKTPELDDIDEPETPAPTKLKSKAEPGIEDVADDIDTTETTPRPLPGKTGVSKTSALQSFKATLPEIKEFTNEKPGLPVRPMLPGLSTDALKKRKKLALGLYKVDKDKDKGAHRLKSYEDLSAINTAVQKLFNVGKEKSEKDEAGAIKLILEHTSGGNIPTGVTLPPAANNGGLAHYASELNTEIQKLYRRQNSDPSKKEDYEGLIKFASEIEAYIDNAQSYLDYKLKSGSKLEDKKADHYKKQYDKLLSSYKNKVEELKTAFRYEKELPDSAGYLNFRKDELDNEFSKGVEKIQDWMPVGKTMPSHAQDKHTVEVTWKKFQEEQGLVPETVKDNVDYFQGLAATAATTLPFYALGIPLGPFGVPLAAISFMYGSNPATRNFLNRLREGDPRGMLNEFTKFIASNYDRANEAFTSVNKNDPDYVPMLKHYEKSPFELVAQKTVTAQDIAKAQLQVPDIKRKLSKALGDIIPNTNLDAAERQELQNFEPLLRGKLPADPDYKSLKKPVNEAEKWLKAKLKDGLEAQGITEDAAKKARVKEFVNNPEGHINLTNVELNRVGNPNGPTPKPGTWTVAHNRVTQAENQLKNIADEPLPQYRDDANRWTPKTVGDNPVTQRRFTQQQVAQFHDNWLKARAVEQQEEAKYNALKNQKCFLNALKQANTLKETLDTVTANTTSTI